MIDLRHRYFLMEDIELKGMALQELFDLRHEKLTLRKIILERLDGICARE